MKGHLVPNLGVSPEIWVVLSGLAIVTFFFKFNRVISLRNLDLLLLFALMPGLLGLVPAPAHSDPAGSWNAYAWLAVGSFAVFIRCLVDLGLARRPVIEPNLNGPGLTVLTAGLLGLVLVETVQLPLAEGAERNPSELPKQSGSEHNPTVKEALRESFLHDAPLPHSLARTPLQEVCARVICVTSQLVIVLGLVTIGWTHYGRRITGLAMAACYLTLPYSRIALIDGGQLVAAALLVLAVTFHQRPIVAGLALGSAALLMPTCLGLLPLWAGFYLSQDAESRSDSASDVQTTVARPRARTIDRFGLVTLGVLAVGFGLGLSSPSVTEWARSVGARSLTSAGLWPAHDVGEPPDSIGLPLESATTQGLWSGIEPSYRLPVLVAYLALVIACAFLPIRKTLTELIALSAALLVASQFWYLDQGGTLILPYLPLLLLIVFRPTLRTRRVRVRRESGSQIPQTSWPIWKPAGKSTRGSELSRLLRSRGENATFGRI